MSFEEILGKVEDENVRGELSGALDKLINDKSADIRRKAQGKAKEEIETLHSAIAELKASIEERDSELEEVRNSSSTTKTKAETEMEKFQKQLDKLNKSLETEKSRADQLEQEKHALVRQNGLDKLLDGVEFVSDKARSSGRVLFNNAMSEVEDFSDEDEVRSVMTQFVEDHPFLIASPNGGGSGVDPKDRGGNVDVGSTDPDKQTDAQRQEHLRKMTSQSMYTP